MTDQDLHKQEKMKVPFTIKDSTRTDVVSIAWPVLVELLLGSLFLMVDMIMIGRIRDSAVAAASVAAVGMTNQPLLIGLSLVQALNVGGTAMVARYLGAKKEHRIENTFKHVLLSLCMLALPWPSLDLFFSTGSSNFGGSARCHTGWRLLLSSHYDQLSVPIHQPIHIRCPKGHRRDQDPHENQYQGELPQCDWQRPTDLWSFGIPGIGVTGAAYPPPFPT